MTLEDLWKLAKKFSWARGVIATVALVSFILPAIGVEAAVTLKLTHAIISAWDFIIADFMNWIMSLLRIPAEIDPWEANSILLISLFLVPFLVSVIRENFATKERSSLSADDDLLLIGLMFFVLIVGLLGVVVSFALSTSQGQVAEDQANYHWSMLVYAMGMIGFLFWKDRKYVFVILIVLSAFGTLELMYHLGFLPGIVDNIVDWLNCRYPDGGPNPQCNYVGWKV